MLRFPVLHGCVTLAVAALAACGARTGLPVPEGASEEGGGGAGGAPPAGGGGEGGVGGVEQLALGAGHSCLRTITGDVYCWGDNHEGQLGLGDFEDRLGAERVELPAKARELAAGSFHTCAALDSGEVYCWGRNDSGQLGTGTIEESQELPAKVEMDVVGGPSPVSLGLGEQHSCVVAVDQAAGSSLYCWGEGGLGQVGPDGTTSTPRLVVSGATAVTAGAFHTCFLDASGQPQCMGENSQLQCGVDIGSHVFFPTPPVFPLSPASVLRISAGRGQHTCVIGYETEQGIRCWGDNDDGQLGVVAFEAGTPLDTATLFLDGATDVKAGFAHTCALVGGRVDCWGSNDSLQLGSLGPSHADPREVAGVTDVVAIATGTLHTCAVRNPTEVLCWGDNDSGQLGDGTTEPSATPVRVALP